MSAVIKVTYSKEVSTIWHMPVNVALCSSQKMFNQRHIEDPDWSKKKEEKEERNENKEKKILLCITTFLACFKWNVIYDI